MHPPFNNKTPGIPPPKNLETYNYEEDDDFDCEWYEPSEGSLAKDFCLNTSLHGLKYLGEGRRHILERFFWFLAVGASVGAAGYFIYGLYHQNMSLPIITVFNPTEKTIGEIPFPAVTICNVNTIRRSKLVEAVAKGVEFYAKHLEHEEALYTYAKLMDMYQVCMAAKTFVERYSNSNNSLFDLEKIVGDIFAKRNEFEELSDPWKTLNENSQSCKDMILHCIWLDIKTDCRELFQEIETEYGLCCTFNLIPLSLLIRNDSRDPTNRVREWRSENLDADKLILMDETQERKYPLRQLYPGKEGGLSVFLNPDAKEYGCTNTDSKGFMVHINGNLDFPRIKMNSLAVPIDSEIFINLNPQITMADKSIEKYSQKKRHCYFGTEHKLPNYKKYTISNCMDECIATKTKDACGCVLYYMPQSLLKSVDTHEDNICRPTQYNCTVEVRKQINQEGLGKSCGDCYPTCNEIVYQSETTSLPIDNFFGSAEYLARNKSSLLNLLERHHPSIVHVYYGYDSTYPRLRKESSSYTDLISNAGGLLGLFLGFSVLSLLEIIYYATIRICCNWYRGRSFENNNASTNIIFSFDPTIQNSYGMKSSKDPRLFVKGPFQGSPQLGSGLSDRPIFSRRINVRTGHYDQFM